MRAMASSWTAATTSFRPMPCWKTDGDVLDETIALDRALYAVEPAKQLRLVILDACRDNPFAKTMKRTLASRAIGGGLAKVEPTSPNTMIAFAAKAGSTASDGDSRNSPFAVALTDHLPKPGLDLRKAFGFVRDDVLKKTGNKQEPYVYGSLGGSDVPLVPARPAAAAGPQANPQDSVRKDYELALQAGLREAWEAFLQTYPEGFYANLARVQLKKIAAEEDRTLATEKARLAEQEKARLATERAQKAELEKAAAAAKAAEGARIAAEKAKQIEQAKAEAAERDRKAAEAAAARSLAEKRALEKVATEAAAKQAADGDSRKVAALSPPPSSPPPGDLAKSVQSELRRVGCLSAAARRRLERRNAALADAVQQICRHSIRREACQCRRARCAEGEAGTCLSARMQFRLQSRWRSMREDHLPGRLPRR
ncbi:putative caspase-like protein [Bradyrhizobium sp. LB7.2]